MPFPNEHSCRLEDPDKYDRFARQSRQSASHNGKTYDVIRGKLKGDDTWEDQAFRYPKDNWSADEAQSHCREHNGTFEAAEGTSASAPCRPCGAKKPARQAIETLLALPWAIRPEWARQMLLIAQRRNTDPAALAAALGEPLDNTRRVSVRDGVATIPVSGPMFRYANLFSEISGASSYEELATDFMAALGDPAVSAILLEINSPGGEVFGTAELSDLIYNARGEKPIVAYIEGYGCSAAYWLASAADEIVAATTAVVGSLGCVMAVPTDDEAEAAEVEFVSSQTPNKRLDPLSQAGREQYQTIVDEIAAVFLADVARNRGISVKAVEQQYGAGGQFVGRSAQKAGLVDRIAGYEALHAELATRNQQGHFMLPTRPHARRPAATAERLAAMLERFGLEQAIRPAALQGAARPLTVLSRSAPSEGGSSPAPTADHQEDRTMAGEATAAAPASGASKNELAEFKARLTEVTNLCAAAGHPALASEYAQGEKTIGQIAAELLAKKREGVEIPPISVPDAGTKVTNVIDREAKKPFATFGEQLQAIATATWQGATPWGLPGGMVDKRLIEITAASGGSTGVGGDGGFAVQRDFTVDLMKEAMGADEIVSRCSTTEIGPNSDGLEVLTLDETSRATGSRWGGVQIYRTKEVPDSAITAKKPKVGLWERRLADLMGVAYMSDRELQDAPAMASVFQEAFREEFGFVVGDEVFRGTGTGECLGFTVADCAVSVAKQTGQLADTVLAENIGKMWARVLPRAKKNGVWFINTEVNDQLDQLMIGTGVSGQLVFMPPGGLSGQSYGTIKGRPVIEIEQAAALGDLGDIVFADLSYYKLITKGGIQAAESIHLRFLYNERAFRWVSRVNGAPKLKSAITPYKGASGATLSPFVTLAARA